MRTINKFVRENNFNTTDISSPSCEGMMVQISEELRANIRCYGSDDYEAEIFYKGTDGKYRWRQVIYSSTQKAMVQKLQELL